MENICSKPCGECPFSSKSAKGWLGGYTIEQIKDFMKDEVLFPCHKTLTGSGHMSVQQVHVMIEAGVFKLCRGYTEMLAKSCYLPYRNPQLVEALKFVKQDGLSENTMAIWDFITHHTVEFKPE